MTSEHRELTLRSPLAVYIIKVLSSSATAPEDVPLTHFDLQDLVPDMTQFYKQYKSIEVSFRPPKQTPSAKADPPVFP